MIYAVSGRINCAQRRKQSGLLNSRSIRKSTSMHLKRLFPVALGLASLSLLTVPAVHAAGPAYTLTDLGTLGGASSQGNAVNDAGQVAGDADTASRFRHTFLSDPANGSKLKDLRTLGGPNSDGNGVNAQGQVTGDAQTAGNSPTPAFLSGANGGALTALASLGSGGGFGRAVNSSGQVGGYSADGSGTHAALWSANGGSPADLGTLGGFDSFGYGINDAGQVAGIADNAWGYSRAFLSDPANGNKLKDVGDLGGLTSRGYAVNAGGQVAGDAALAGVLPPNTLPYAFDHAFLSGPNGTGPLLDLGTLGGTFSSARAVNDAGQVVGYAAVGPGDPFSAPQHAFLFTDGQLYDLNNLIPPGSDFTLNQALGISNTDFITGYGATSSGQQHAFLLAPTTPVPEFSTTASFGMLLCFGGTLVAGRRKRAQASEGGRT